MICELYTYSIRQGPILAKRDLHCPDGANGHALTATGTFIRIKNNGHVRTMESQCTGWADTGTGTALETFFIITTDACGKALDPYTKPLQIFKTRLDIAFASLQAKNHHSLPMGQDIRLQDI